MWCYRSTALKLKLRRALQVSAEGFTEGHIATQLTQAQGLEWIHTATGHRWPTAATTYLTEQATPHLAASTAAATPRLTSVYKQATPYRTVISADRPTTYGVSGFTTEGARRVGLGHLRRTRRAMQMAKSPLHSAADGGRARLPPLRGSIAPLGKRDFGRSALSSSSRLSHSPCRGTDWACRIHKRPTRSQGIAAARSSCS